MRLQKRVCSVVLIFLLVLPIISCSAQDAGFLGSNPTVSAQGTNSPTVENDVDANAAGSEEIKNAAVAQEIVIDPEAYRYYAAQDLAMPAVEAGQNVSVIGVLKREGGFAVLFFVYTFNEYYERYGYAMIALYDLDGYMLSVDKIDLPEDTIWGSPSSFVKVPSGGFAVLFGNTLGMNNVCFLDEQAQFVDSVKIASAENDSTFYHLFISETDDMYVGGYGVLKVFSRDGTVLVENLQNSVDGRVFDIGGTLYVNGFSSTGGGYGVEAFLEIYPDGSVSHEPSGIPFPDMDYMSFEGSLYSSNTDSFYRFNTKKGIPEPVFFWSRTGLVTGNSMRHVYPMSEDVYVCLLVEWNTNVESLHLLVRQPESFMSDKEIVTIAGGSGSVGLQEAVVDFNAASEQYWIEIVDYYQRYSNNIGVDMETYEANLEAADLRIRAEILAGEGPDMIYGSFEELKEYRDAGMLKDLMPMIESGESIHPEDMVQSIWKACLEGESLYIAPLSFEVVGMYASKEYFGDRTGITFEDNAEIIAGLPANVRYGYDDVYSRQLSKLLAFSLDYFIDTESETVDFDNPEFGLLLEYVKTFGVPPYDPNQSYEYNEEDIVSAEDLWPKGEIVIPETWLGKPWTYADIKRAASSGLTFSGYPSADASGPMGYISSAVAIVDKEQTSAACQLIFDTLYTEKIQKVSTADYDRYMYDSYPILNSLLEEYLLLPQEKTPRTNWFMVESPQKITKADADAVRTIINNVTEIYVTYPELEQIILEEAMPYINDQKTLEEVLPLIQNRVSLYVAERGGI
ncbi:MAG TPA: carbohydrate ABC transporter substrate-binding protein [Clostridiaceae bacterium]|nr:carbohydrate ABC transporter substrate-binding protein [Clostridiaceae bacterium]